MNNGTKKSKFSQAIHLKLPGQNDEVISFGKSAEQEESDLLNQLGRVGGDFRQPSYARAYLRAARTLLDVALKTNDLDQLCLPIFYLQRHATELLLKRLLNTLHEIVSLRMEMRITNSPIQISEGALKRLGKHKIRPLYDDLIELSRSLNLTQSPPDLRELISLIEENETTDTWSRYPTSKPPVETLHLRSEVVIKVGEIQRLLEVAFQSTDINMDLDTETFEEEIYYDLSFLLQQKRNE